MVGSTSDATSYAAQILEFNNTPIIVLRDDGAISIATSTVTANTTIIGDNLVVGGTLTASYTGSVTAGNVSGGVFSSNVGASNFAFPMGLGVNTSTQVSLPQALSVYGGGYITGNLGIGTAAPLDLVGVVGSNTSTNTAFGGTLGIALKNTTGTVGNFTSIVNYNSVGTPNSGIYFKNIDQVNAGEIDFITRSSSSFAQNMIDCK